MRILIASALFFIVNFCQGQENTAVKTYFIRDKIVDFATVPQSKIVKTIDSADYIRTVSIAKNNEDLYDVTEFYLDKNKRRIGNSLTNGFAPKYNGNVISYYKNGNTASEELFVTGRRKGLSTYYYTNKQVKKSVDYGFDKNKSTEKVLALNDSLGTHFLDEAGTGSFKILDESGNSLEGTYVNGLRDKTWKTVNAKNSVTYFDEYDAGKYVKGRTLNADGKTVKYDKLEDLPSFKGSLQAFGSFLSGSLHYPPDARDNDIQGRVFLQFVIEKDGELTEAKVVRGIGSGCDEEALRVIKESPKWNPGTQRGIPVRMSYTVPIFFKLGTSRSPTTLERRNSSSPFGR